MNQRQIQHSNTVAFHATPDPETQQRKLTRTDVAPTNAYRIGFADGLNDQPRAPHLHRYTLAQIRAYNNGYYEGLDLSDNKINRT